jgi:hypothetical protein
MLLLMLLKFEFLGTAAQRSQTAAEAGSLAAAAELSRIVVNDPYYGFIALSNYPAYGKATLAEDGEPLPVLGINEIFATARLQTIIAEQLNNDELKRLAHEDVHAARHAAKLLTDALEASIDPSSNYKARDLDGNTVKPFELAKQTYVANLGGIDCLGKAHLDDFRLSLGWLKKGANSNIKAPLPSALSATPEAAKLKDNYRAFIDIPASGESFYFAGLSQQPSLADINQFAKPDGKRFCSIVRVDAALSFKEQNGSKLSDGTSVMHSSACAEPCSMPDTTIPGVLAINMMHGLVPGITSIQDIFDNEQLNANKVQILTADGGDFPFDSTSRLVSGPEYDSVKSISQTFATGFHDWLRTAHNKVRIDSVIDAVSTKFRDSARIGSGHKRLPNLFYEIQSDGLITISNVKQSPFYRIDTFDSFNNTNAALNRRFRECTHDQQDYALSFGAISTGAYDWMMVYRNYTRTLGTVAGGKHAGQVFPADPVNWCDLSQFNSSPEQALLKGEGEQAKGLQVHGQMYDDSAVMLNGAYFTKRDGTALASQPRKSGYAGGLATYFELSSPLERGL